MPLMMFQLPFKNVLTKYLFSIMNYNKNKNRARLNNRSVASIIHTRDIVKVTDNIAAPFTPTDLAIDFQRALNHKLE